MAIDTILNAFGRETGVFALMNTAWAWPIAESLHFIGLSLLLGTIGIVDLRLLGFPHSLSLQAVHKITRLGVVGFAINAITGAAFVVSDADQYVYNPAFQLKVACMLLAAGNVVAFYVFAWPRVLRSPGGVVPLAAKVCAAVSLGAWLGVIVFGRLITFYRPPEHWCFWC